MPKLLRLVDYNDPVLAKTAVAVEFPLSEEDKKLIADMKYSIQPEQLKAAKAPFETAAGMACNQWGIAKRIFLFCPSGNTQEGLEVIINPRYEIINKDIYYHMWEGCFSIPMAAGNIARYFNIKVNYNNESGQTITRELQGHEARVWQHENDHLDGYLYDNLSAGKCLKKVVFASQHELDNFWNGVREERRKKLSIKDNNI
jgi:peptide deformylase